MFKRLSVDTIVCIPGTGEHGQGICRVRWRDKQDDIIYTAKVDINSSDIGKHFGDLREKELILQKMFRNTEIEVYP